MLVVEDKVNSEQAMGTSRTFNVDEFIWPHGITPPLHYARKRRFRKRANKRVCRRTLWDRLILTSLHRPSKVSSKRLNACWKQTHWPKLCSTVSYACCIPCYYTLINSITCSRSGERQPGPLRFRIHRKGRWWLRCYGYGPIG
jgi:hypothetical protein